NNCFVCGKLIDGPTYVCNECKYYLHKRYALFQADQFIFNLGFIHTTNLTCTLDYPSLLCQRFVHQMESSPPNSQPWLTTHLALFLCFFLHKQFRPSSGFVYHCDPCKFDLHINCALLQSSIAPNFPTPLHQHPLLFIQDHNEEVNRDCSGCMKPLSGPIYHCSDCSLSDEFFNLHKQCAELPLEINHTYGHRKHPLTFLPKRPTHLHNCSCYLCKIQWEGFVYSCSFCKIELTLDDFFSPQTITNENHEHPWTLLSRQRLTFSGEMNNDGQCDGCMRTISTPFYSCEQCKFFLHKECAELPRNKRHPFHKHLLTLTNSNTVIFHPSHEHSLFLVHNFSANCNACRRKSDPWNMAYRCTKHCEFTLDLECATLPLTAWYKYDRYPLTLTCFNDSDPSQHYCDLCEYERDQNDWFYYCTGCDNSLHSKCALGDLPFLKIGSNIDKRLFHKHHFTIVKNIWDCPPCKFCGEVCNGQALQLVCWCFFIGWNNFHL
ncbi:hypothetical protein ERO13_A03G042650v2, partial [Gossypium hirsutum]